MSLEHAGVSWELQRVPPDPGLQAWDAADEYLLAELPSFERAVVLNDSFGALACALHAFPRVSVGDSWLAREGLRANEAGHVEAPAEWKWWDEDWGSGFDLALVKIPKHHSLLVEQLTRLRDCLAPDGRVIGAGMTRHVHTRTVQAFERLVGPTTTTRARKKARLILSSPEAPSADPLPLRKWEHDGVQVVAYPGVFSGRRLDAGTALLLRHLPDVGPGRTVVDLGCGTGVLAATVARRNPEARVVAVDESRAAVLSAQATFEANGLVPAGILHTDGLRDLDDASVDLVLSNPPQHQNAALGRAMLEQLLADCARVLAPGGEVRMVANRHVNLNRALAAHFRQVRVLGQDRQYMVVGAGRALR